MATWIRSRAKQSSKQQVQEALHRNMKRSATCLLLRARQKMCPKVLKTLLRASFRTSTVLNPQLLKHQTRPLKSHLIHVRSRAAPTFQHSTVLPKLIQGFSKRLLMMPDWKLHRNLTLNCLNHSIARKALIQPTLPCSELKYGNCEWQILRRTNHWTRSSPRHWNNWKESHFLKKIRSLLTLSLRVGKKYQIISLLRRSISRKRRNRENSLAKPLKIVLVSLFYGVLYVGELFL